MILVNTDYISGKDFEMLGLVKGSTIQSKHIGKDIMQSLKTIVGGELKDYNIMMMEARELATKEWRRRRKPSAQTQLSISVMLRQRLCRAPRRLWLTVLRLDL